MAAVTDIGVGLTHVAARIDEEQQRMRQRKRRGRRPGDAEGSRGYGLSSSRNALSGHDKDSGYGLSSSGNALSGHDRDSGGSGDASGVENRSDAAVSSNTASNIATDAKAQAETDAEAEADAVAGLETSQRLKHYSDLLLEAQQRHRRAALEREQRRALSTASALYAATAGRDDPYLGIGVGAMSHLHSILAAGKRERRREERGKRKEER